MANLTSLEKAIIENFLGMRNGYIMDFSDKKFRKFIEDSTELDINSEKYYNYISNSQANRLRRLIKLENNYTLGKLLSAFCDYWLAKIHSGQTDFLNEASLYKECLQIAERLKQESIIEQLTIKQLNSNNKDFAILSDFDKITSKTELFKLHKLVEKDLRLLCENSGLAINEDEPLSDLIDKYINDLEVNRQVVDFRIVEKILKYAINIFDVTNSIEDQKGFRISN